MRKVIFLDVDGTLINHSRNIPESAKEALIKAKQNGHYLVLCTGRTHKIIESELLIYFDGVVASAGAHILWGNEEIYHSSIPKEAISHAIKVLDKYGANYVFQGNSGRVADEVNRNALIEFFAVTGEKDISKSFVDNSDYHLLDKYSIESGFYIHATRTVEEIQEELGDVIKVTGASFGNERVYNGELTLNGVNKATGMERLLTHLGLTQADSVAFGDGPNDFEMIEYAHVGVAMGNAIDELKIVANMVTDHIDEDGLYNGFVKLGLIN